MRQQSILKLQYPFQYSKVVGSSPDPMKNLTSEKGFKIGILDIAAYLTRRQSLFVTFIFPQIQRNRILRHSRSYSFVNVVMLNVQVKYYFKKIELQLQLMV